MVEIQPTCTICFFAPPFPTHKNVLLAKNCKLFQWYQLASIYSLSPPPLLKIPLMVKIPRPFLKFSFVCILATLPFTLIDWVNTDSGSHNLAFYELITSPNNWEYTSTHNYKPSVHKTVHCCFAQYVIGTTNKINLSKWYPAFFCAHPWGN